VKHSVIFLLFFVIVTKANSQSKDHIITHFGDTLYGEIKAKKAYGELYSYDYNINEIIFFIVKSIDENGKKINNTVYPSNISILKKRHETYISKWVNDKKSLLFDEKDRKEIKGYNFWVVESEKLTNSGIPNLNNDNSKILTTTSYMSYYLELKDGYLTQIPESKKKLAKFLREQDCNTVAKGVETGYLDHKDMRLVLEEYLDRCQ
jgi:hypothetical protein